jgi:hypothetical protein
MDRSKVISRYAVDARRTYSTGPPVSAGRRCNESISPPAGGSIWAYFLPRGLGTDFSRLSRTDWGPQFDLPAAICSRFGTATRQI